MFSRRLRCLIAAIALLAVASNLRLPVRAASAPRIVSLIPSLTEDLFAIGAGSQIVGVSEFTDYPAIAHRLPVIGSFASLDAERVAGLHPDLIVGIDAQARLARDLRRLGLHVELLPDDTFADLFTTIARLGVLSGRPAQATKLATRLRARTAQLVARVPKTPQPRTFVVLGVSPIYTVGDRSYIAQLIALAGGRNASGLREAYAPYGAEALVAAQPDAIVADAQSGLRAVLAREPWRSLAAVRTGRVYVLANADVLERPGPRYNDGLAWLIARLHPDASR